MRGISVVLLLTVAAPLAAAGSWTRTRAGGFEVVSNAGDRATREVVKRLLAAEAVFRDAPEAPRSMPPVRVVLFGSDRDYLPFRLGPDVEGIFQSAPDRLWLALRAGAQDPGRVAVHEYVHAILSRSPVRLPAWLDEGLPELYSTISATGDRVILGEAIPGRVRALEASKWLSGTELSGSAKDRAAIFYAQSWALTHMLSLGPEYRDHMPAFVGALADGIPAASAFRQAFGKSLDEALRDLRSYVIRPVVVRTGPVTAATAEAPEAVLEPESLAIRAELLYLLRSETDGAAMYADLMRRFPDSPEAKTAAAVLAMRRGDVDRARDLLREAAVARGGTASSWFEYAMLLNDARAPDAEVDAALAKVVELSPGHAEAHVLLGVHAGRAGRWEDAERELRRAAALLPRESRVWYELAWALKNGGKIDSARDAARKAVQLSATKDDEARARALLDGLDAS